MTAKLRESLARRHAERTIRALVVKLKFSDFERTTAERAHPELDESVFRELLRQAWSRGRGRGVRLLGAGVRFHDPDQGRQLDLQL
jgi:DNA polymerase-4